MNPSSLLTPGPLRRFASYRAGGRPPAVVLGDLCLVRPLAMAGVETLVVTADASAPTLRSNAVTYGYLEPALGRRDPAAMVAGLEALAARLGLGEGRRAPLFYGTDPLLEAIVTHRERLGRYYAFLVNDDDLARALLDKGRFSTLCAARDVRTPRALANDDTARALATLRAPLIVKPKDKVDWKEMKATLLAGAKARVFASAEALLAEPDFARYRPRVVVQEYVPGGPDALRSFHGFVDNDGRLVASYGGRKVRTYPPVEGESSFIELVVDPALAAAGEDVVRRLGLRGVFKIDFKYDERVGEFFALEVNARFNLWNYLGAVHGVNLPALAYEYFLTGAVPATRPGYTPRYHWVDLYTDFKSFREEQRRGRLTLAGWLASLASAPNVYESFAPLDPLPALTWLAQHLGGRFAP